jgi:hypothetical protein
MNPLSTTAQNDSPAVGIANSPTIDREFKADYDAGKKKGLQEGTNWAKKGWEVPSPIGISAMATTRVADIKPIKPEAWRHGFEMGFRAGYTSIRPITRKDDDYDQLSWSNAQAGVKLYDYNEKHEAPLSAWPNPPV